MTKSLALTLALCCFAIACAQPAPAPTTAPPPKPDLVAEESAIRELDARWLKAAQARDAAAESALFASDGIAIRTAGVFAGPSAYRAHGEKNYADNPKSQVTWTTDAIHIAESADLAVQYGQSETIGLGAKGDGKDRTRFVTVWKKVNGGWQVAYDIGTPMSTAPPPKS
jgi:uncharacterized protein (TIGR02246 family)